MTFSFFSRRRGLVLLPVLMMACTGAAAQSVVVPGGETLSTPLLLGQPGDTLTVDAGGIIDVTGFDVNAVEGTASDQTFTNNGRVLLNDQGGSDGSAIRSKGDAATIVNGGSIEAINIAIGIRSDGNGSSIANSGTIDADSYGIRSTGDQAVITNTGKITGLNHGIRSDGDHADIVNHGTVLGSPQGTVVDIHGIRSGGDFASITNTGRAYGDADGVFSIGDNARIINYGTLDGGTSGLGSQGDHAVIVNFGTITGAERAIGLVGMESELVLMPGSVVEGLVRFDGIDEALTLPDGQSRFLAYGGVVSTVNSAAPFINDTANQRVISIDPTSFAAPGIWLQTLTGIVQQAMHDRGRVSPAGSASTFVDGVDASGRRGKAWLSGFGGHQNQSADGPLTSMKQRYGGGMAGGGLSQGDVAFGAYAGGFHSRFETDNASQSVDSTSAFAGVYGVRAYGDIRLNVALMGGYAGFDSERLVANNLVDGGFESAAGDFDGYFLSPSLSLTRSVGDRATLGLSGRYAALFLDGYQETGSMGGLLIDSRTVQVAALRGETNIRAAEWLGDQGHTSIMTWFGVDGQFNLGGDTINGTVGGLPIGFSASYADAAAIGFAGLGLSHKSLGGWAVDANIEGRYGTGQFWEVRATAMIGRGF